MSWWCQFERLSCLCYLIIVLSVHWVNKLNHCHQLFDHVHNLDVNWNILNTAGLFGFFFYFSVNNSGWTCYYQLQGFFFHLGLCFMFTSCYYKLPWEPFSSWESIQTGTVITRDLLSPTARTIIQIVDFILCSIRTHIYNDTHYRHGLFHFASTSL